MQTQKKHRLKQLRRWRIRKKINGTKERPRMAVCFTGQHIYVQFVDDTAGRTLASASTRAKGQAGDAKLAANVKSAKTIGGIAARAAIDQGINRVVFDRGGLLYHGKVKALADAAREAGLKI
jgi:large subunit ribosomal protein L18